MFYSLRNNEFTFLCFYFSQRFVFLVKRVIVLGTSNSIVVFTMVLHNQSRSWIVLHIQFLEHKKTIGLCFAMKPIDGTFRTDLVWRNLCLFVDKVKQVNNEQRVRNETIIWHLAFYQKVSSDSPDDSSNSCMLLSN